jgi:hypothetical protein
MAKKIVRLTESDLSKLIRRVIKEQEIDYTGITDAMKNGLIGKTSQFTPSGGKPTQFKITEIITPTDLTKPRILTIKGTTGMVTTDGFTPNVVTKEVYVSYRCVTSSDKDKTAPITYQGTMNSPQNVKGTLTKGLVNNIETSWCQKLPPMPSNFM